jgi:hypothetical protein
MTTTGLTYIGATERAAEASADRHAAWVRSGRPTQLALEFLGTAGPVPFLGAVA